MSTIGSRVGCLPAQALQYPVGFLMLRRRSRLDNSISFTTDKWSGQVSGVDANQAGTTKPPDLNGTGGQVTSHL